MISDQIVVLQGKDLEAYGVAKLRDQAFDAMRSLWLRRQLEGMTQKEIAEAIGRDTAWVSRNLSAPGNWTIRTIGALTQGLRGEIELKIAAREDPVDTPSNFNAYDGYLPSDPTQIRIGGGPGHQIEMKQKVIQFDLVGAQ